MESRWRFLHYNITELWGHRGKARAGNEKTGASEVVERQANPFLNTKA